jgi:hypothetical protein
MSPSAAEPLTNARQTFQVIEAGRSEVRCWRDLELEVVRSGTARYTNLAKTRGVVIQPAEFSTQQN